MKERHRQCLLWQQLQWPWFFLAATGFISYLPVPVLTAIVISALMNVVELHLAVRLFRVSRNEFYIFVAACVSVLVFGTIYGVVIGLLLSFVAVVLRANKSTDIITGNDSWKRSLL